MKSAVTAIIGRPSAGKSSLVNTMCGRKVSIVAPHPQTTRNRIRGIVNRKEGQLLFIDTPGYHISDRKFNTHLKAISVNSLAEADIILYLIDSTRLPGSEEEKIAGLVAPYKDKLVVALNKIDADQTFMEQNRVFVFLSFGIKPYEISAKNGTGVEALISAIFGKAEEGDPMYPEDIYTDQDPEFRAAEIIREKAVNKLKDEVPHAVYVGIADMELQDGRLWIRAFIFVERNSQKGILVGKGASMIRSIRVEAEKELNELFSDRVKLDLSVKVKPKWRRKDSILKGLIN